MSEINEPPPVDLATSQRLAMRLGLEMAESLFDGLRNHRLTRPELTVSSNAVAVVAIGTLAGLIAQQAGDAERHDLAMAMVDQLAGVLLGAKVTKQEPEVAT